MDEKNLTFQFIALTFAWSWGFFLLAALASQGFLGAGSSSAPLIIAGAFGPTLAALYIAVRRGGMAEAIGLLRGGFRFRVPVAVWVFAAVTPLAIAAAGQFWAGDREVSIEPTLPVIFVVLFFLGGSFGEEFGWRGFLLPRLLHSRSAFSASLVIGAVWSLWHLPLFWVKGTSQFTTPFWLYVVYITALAFQYTWVYLRTGGNLFACLLLHTFTNMTVIVLPLAPMSDQLPRFAIETALNLAVAAALIAVNRARFSRKELPPPQ